MRDVQTILTCKRRFGKTQQIDRVQDIRFALSVESDEAVEFGTKLQTRLADIAVVENI